MNCITRASRGSVKSTLIKNSPLIFRQIGFYLAKSVYFSNLANFSSASGNPECLCMYVREQNHLRGDLGLNEFKSNMMYAFITLDL